MVEPQNRAFDFVHMPAGVAHVFVGAGDGPCVIVMVGVRSAEKTLRYPVSELAQRHGAGVAMEAHTPKEAYADAGSLVPINSQLDLVRELLRSS